MTFDWQAIGGFAAFVLLIFTVVPAILRWWRDYRYPSWVDAWLHRRKQNAALRGALREAEKVAPGLLMELQRSLKDDPDRRRFRVRQGNCLVVADSSVGPIIDYTDKGDGDLGGWVAQHADGLFQLVPSMNRPPVYEMSEELARYLNGRG